jgi:hypothetical protein
MSFGRSPRSPSPSLRSRRTGMSDARSHDGSGGGGGDASRRDALRAMRPGALQRKAMALGVDPARVCDAMDSSSPEETLIGLILAAENPASSECRKQAAKLRAMCEADHRWEELQRQDAARALDAARTFTAALRKGQHCVYFDLQKGDWLQAVVERVHADGYHVDLWVSASWHVRGIDASRIRPLSSLEEEEHRERQVRWRLGEHVQYYNAASSSFTNPDWIEAVITDVAHNAAGRVNSVSLKVCYSKHWPVEDAVVPRVPVQQVRARTKQRAEEEEARARLRWDASLRPTDADEIDLGGLAAHEQQQGRPSSGGAAAPPGAPHSNSGGYSYGGDQDHSGGEGGITWRADSELVDSLSPVPGMPAGSSSDDGEDFEEDDEGDSAMVAISGQLHQARAD